MKKFSLFCIALLAAFLILGPQVNFSFATGGTVPIDGKSVCTTTVVGDGLGNCAGDPSTVECYPNPNEGLACAEHGQCTGLCKTIGSCTTANVNDTSGGCPLANFCNTGGDTSSDCTNSGKCSGTCEPNDDGGACNVTGKSAPFPGPQGSCDTDSTCDTSQDSSGQVGTCVFTNTTPVSPPCDQYVLAKDSTGKVVGQICASFNTGLGTISTDAVGFIQSAFGILLAASGSIALLLIMRAGYKIMTSQGNPEAIKEGREQLIAAIVGLFVLIFALVFLQLIGVDILKIPGLGA